MRVHSLARVLAPPVNAALRAQERRRRPDLGALARDPRFRDLDAAAAAWAGGNFRLIEENAPWLSRLGGTVLDYCMAGTWPQGVLHRGIFHVTAIRWVAVVYGFDGELASGLGRLSDALTSAGWKDEAAPGFPPDPVRLRLAGKTPPAAGRWRPEPGRDAGEPGRAGPRVAPAGPPVAGPGAWARITVAWETRGTPAGTAATLLAVGEDPGQATDFYHPVEVRHGDAAGLVATALRQHPNAAAIRITLVYYRQRDGLSRWDSGDQPRAARRRRRPAPPPAGR